MFVFVLFWDPEVDMVLGFVWMLKIYKDNDFGVRIFKMAKELV